MYKTLNYKQQTIKGNSDRRWLRQRAGEVEAATTEVDTMSKVLTQLWPQGPQALKMTEWMSSQR